MATKGWPCQRLSQLVTAAPRVAKGKIDEREGSQLLIPSSPAGRSSSHPGGGTEVRETTVLVDIDSGIVEPGFLAAWLNTEHGVMSRIRASNAAAFGTSQRHLRDDPKSLMRWADELVVPVPDRKTQLSLASTDELLQSYHTELTRLRERVWDSAEGVSDIVARISAAFDDSGTAWLEQWPYPIAMAIWRADTEKSPGDKLRAYLQAWEAIVAFHAIVLLSATRCDPGRSAEIEGAIRSTLQLKSLGIDRASFGTWIVIIEQTSKQFRSTVESGDADELARAQDMFGGLSRSGIERLIAKEIVRIFKELAGKRNQWSGHSGYVSEEDQKTRVDSLISDIRGLRQLLGPVWTQLTLVRAGTARRKPDGYLQTAELAIGTRSPFQTMEFLVGDSMLDGELYLLCDGAQTPLHLASFVQLRAAPRDARFTSYFYNRTVGDSVTMVTYQYGPESEVHTDVATFEPQFGALRS